MRSAENYWQGPGSFVGYPRSGARISQLAAIGQTGQTIQRFEFFLRLGRMPPNFSF